MAIVCTKVVQTEAGDEYTVAYDDSGMFKFRWETDTIYDITKNDTDVFAEVICLLCQFKETFEQFD